MADKPIELHDHKIVDNFITGVTKDGANIRAAITKQLGNVVHTTEHIFHLQKPAPKPTSTELGVTPKAR
jgi:hypothetical protein